MLFVSTAAVIMSMTGCSENGLAVNTMNGNKIARYYKKGVVLRQEKVVINDKDLAILTGAGVGGVATAVATRNAKAATLATVAGGVLGAFVGHQINAYKTVIGYYGNRQQICFVKKILPVAQTVEFTTVKGKCKNLNVVNGVDHLYKNENNIVQIRTTISRPLQKNKIWFYELGNGVVLNSLTHYKTKNKEWNIKYDSNNNTIISLSNPN